LLYIVYVQRQALFVKHEEMIALGVLHWNQEIVFGGLHAQAHKHCDLVFIVV
jgi:hypothetical protein